MKKPQVLFGSVLALIVVWLIISAHNAAETAKVKALAAAQEEQQHEALHRQNEARRAAQAWKEHLAREAWNKAHPEEVARRKEAERERIAREQQAQAEAEIKRKAEVEAAQAQQKAEQERVAAAKEAERQERESHTPCRKFGQGLDSLQVGNVLSSYDCKDIGSGVYSIHITVRDEAWRTFDYDQRLQLAKGLWGACVKYAEPSQADSCHVRLVGEAGEDLGGSNDFAGSMIDVSKD